MPETKSALTTMSVPTQRNVRRSVSHPNGVAKVIRVTSSDSWTHARHSDDEAPIAHFRHSPRVRGCSVLPDAAPCHAMPEDRSPSPESPGSGIVITSEVRRPSPNLTPILPLWLPISGVSVSRTQAHNAEISRQAWEHVRAQKAMRKTRKPRVTFKQLEAWMRANNLTPESLRNYF